MATENNNIPKLRYYVNLREVRPEEVNDRYDEEVTLRLYEAARAEGRDLVFWREGNDLHIATEKGIMYW